MKLSEKIQEALRQQQEINLSDPVVQKRLAAQWGYVPADAQPAPGERSITAGVLSGMFLSLDGHDKAQPGYEWRKGWNDALRQAMDYAQPAPSVPDGWKEGVESAARLIDQKAELYAIRFGHDDLRGLSFGAGPHAEIKMDHYTNLIELADEVRATLAAAPETKT